MSKKEYASSVKLGLEELMALSRIYVNKNDQLYKNAKKIPSVEGFEDFVGHSYEKNYILYETTNNVDTKYSAFEFAEMLRNDPEYHGGNIRLLSCSAGAGENSIAQQIADILGVDVLAPTEDLYVNSKGELFVTNYPGLADLWDNGEPVSQTGEMKLFNPNKEVNNDEQLDDVV